MEKGSRGSLPLDFEPVFLSAFHGFAGITEPLNFRRSSAVVLLRFPAELSQKTKSKTLLRHTANAVYPQHCAHALPSCSGRV